MIRGGLHVDVVVVMLKESVNSFDARKGASGLVTVGRLKVK